MMNEVENKKNLNISNSLSFWHHLLVFFDTNTLYFASSLSFFTIFAFFPILSLVLYASYFLFFTNDTNYLIQNSIELINPTNSGFFLQIFDNFSHSAASLNILGSLYLVFIFLLFFNDYEAIVNKIHKCKKRSPLKVLFIYFITLLIVFLCFGVSAFLEVIFSNSYVLHFSIYIFYYFVLVAILKISINKKINIKGLFLSAFLIYNILKITKIIFVYIMNLNTTYTTLYGSFSVALFAFLWVYFFWIAYLYGIKLYYYIDTGKIYIKILQKKLKKTKNYNNE